MDRAHPSVGDVKCDQTGIRVESPGQEKNGKTKRYMETIGGKGGEGSGIVMVPPEEDGPEPSARRSTVAALCPTRDEKE